MERCRCDKCDSMGYVIGEMTDEEIYDAIKRIYGDSIKEGTILLNGSYLFEELVKRRGKERPLSLALKLRKEHDHE